MSHKITREQLYKEVWLRPLREIAKDFNVSDVAVVKACKKNNIPRPAQGHWAKLKAGNNNYSLSISTRYDKPATFIWLDNEETRIEKSITNIIIKIILSGEIQHRHAIQQQHEWAIEHRDDLIEEERLRVEEEKRVAIELREKQEKDRIDKLLFEAESLQKAVTIRNYVSSILESSDRIEATQATIEDWAKWALIQADRIDPVKNLAFLDMNESHSE